MKIHLSIIIASAIALFASCNTTQEQENVSGAGLSLEAWAAGRMESDGSIPSQKYYEAHQLQQISAQNRGDFDEEWNAIGPKNFGGRTLCLAFHPTDEQTIFVGSAGGGLWKTTTQGDGVEGWQAVETGFPVIAVSSIAINPNDPDEMYIGTGEIYNYTVAEPGIVNRLTRGTYGMGILKSLDGGETWQKALDWSMEEMRGVWEVVINPQATNEIYAATTIGLYKSNDSGATWNLIHNKKSAVDIELHPTNPDIIFVTHGAYQGPDSGVYRSENAGATWQLLDNGIPTNYTGKTMISISPSNPDIIYASVANDFESIGLYQSLDGGDSWTLKNAEDVARFQGWYAHDIAIKPTDSNTIIYAGVDVWKTTDAGANLEQRSFWFLWDFGQTPVGGSEGPVDYVHADIHALYYSPFDANTVFAVCDGGIFVSESNGNFWEGRNGGYQTQQFYANFACSATNGDLAMGGLQDNATAIYIGDDAWVRVIGGDGMSAAIDPTDEQTLYGSSQNLGMRKSMDGGANFFSIRPDEVVDELRSFSGPYELAPSNPNVIFAGAQRLYKSTNGGISWTTTTNDFIDDENPIYKIAISPTDIDLIYLSIAAVFGENRVLKSTDGGATCEDMSGLPNYLASDIAIDPNDDDIVYLSFLGFGETQVLKTTDGGQTWASSDESLPNIPTNTIIVDADNNNHIYLGNDLGVYASVDAGASWAAFSNALPTAMVMDLAISPSNNMLRAATHGRGVWEAELLDIDVATTDIANANAFQIKDLYPNPVINQINMPYQSLNAQEVNVDLYTNDGKWVHNLANAAILKDEGVMDFNVADLTSGIYYLTISNQNSKVSKGFIVR